MEIVVKEHPTLWQPSSLDTFLRFSPGCAEGISLARQQLQGRCYPREDLVSVLADYNAFIGNDAKAQKQIQRLADADTYCVVTGQQPGLLGGPAYTMLKAITCLQVARDAEAVPIFWAATEDHDVGEVNRAFHLDPRGNLVKLSLPLPSRSKICLEDLILDEQHQEMISTFCDVLKVPSEIRELSLHGRAFGEAFVRMLVKLFAGTGLVFVEPHLMRPLSKSFFAKELTEHAVITKTLQDTKERLVAAGGCPTLDVEKGTNLFFKDTRNRRHKIQVSDSQKFIINAETYALEQLLELLETQPQRFSTGAAARTVLQSQCFPTMIYVAGPGELTYYRQLRDYHRFHDVPMPWIIPRLSATFVPSNVQPWLEQCGLVPWEEVPSRWGDVSRTRDVPSYALHFLRNLLRPRGKLQERIFSWWEFQGKTTENLVYGLLYQTHWQQQGHHYILFRTLRTSRHHDG